HRRPAQDPRRRTGRGRQRAARWRPRTGRGRRQRELEPVDESARGKKAMVLSDVCIRRPVFATVMSLVILLLGLISFQRLSVREYRKIDEPVVSVSTTYRGASPDVMESRVTKPLEDSLAGIEGVDVMTSQSRSETSNITIRFKLTRDPDAAAADVRD